MPCQVPNANRPPHIGIVTDVPTIVDLQCDGMSSGPSSVWSYNDGFSGTILSNALAMSLRTSGSQFSFIVSPQLVWHTNKCNKPTLGNSGKRDTTSPVIKWQPRRRDDNIISTCFIIILFSVKDITFIALPSTILLKTYLQLKNLLNFVRPTSTLQKINTLRHIYHK